MASYTQHRKSTNRVADVIVGYSVITVDDSKVFTLADGVNNVGAPFPIPTGTTGARIEIEFTTTANEMRVVSAPSFTPNVSSKKGEQILENGTVLILGTTAETKFDPSEVTNFKMAMKAGCVAKAQVTFYRINA